MPSFEIESTRAFWEHYMGGQVSDIIKYMELFEEDSTHNNTEVKELFIELGSKFDHATSIDPIPLKEFIKIAASMHMSQKLRLMQVIDSITPGKATQMISVAEANQSDAACAKFLERNKKFECTRILREVYQPDRLKALMSLYE
jgi:hypothetical protein